MSLEFNADKQIIKGSNQKLIGTNELSIRSGIGSDEKEVVRVQLDTTTKLPRVGINRTGQKIEKITINTNGNGSGYSSPPSVIIGPPQTSNGVQAAGTAVISAGSLVAVIIDEQGSGYTSAPSVSFSGGGGSGAAATAYLDTVDFELDVSGAIRTSTSIISDTARILNLDIENFVTPDAKFRSPSLKTYANNTGTLWSGNVSVQKGDYRYFGTNIYEALNTGLTANTPPTWVDGVDINGTVTFKHIGYRVESADLEFYNQEMKFPRSITPPLGDDSDKVATTEYVLNLATNDVGGRVYVSAQIGNDSNDGRSAVAPVRTIKKACQIASQSVGIKETVVVSGGEYTEDNPISIPPDCSVVGDSLRIVIVRPNNPRKHMFKFADKNYISGLTFRDKIDSNGDPVATWDYACAFDDKQRVYYDPTAGGDFGRNFPVGHQIFGPNKIRVPFQTNTGLTALAVNEYVTGVNTGAVGVIRVITFESGNINGSGDVEILSGSFQTGETFTYPGNTGRPWAQTTTYTSGQIIYNGTNVYTVTTGGVSGGTGPVHTSGAAANGTTTLTFLRSAYSFVATDIISIRPEGEVVSHNQDLTTTLPITRIDGSLQSDPTVDGVVFYTNPLIGRLNTHDFKEGQEVEISGLPTSSPDLSMFNGKQRIYKIIRDADGRARRFVIPKKLASFVQNNYIPNAGFVKSYSYYITLSLLNSPNKFLQPAYVSRRYQDACNLIRNNIEFIKDETYLQIEDEFCPNFSITSIQTTTGSGANAGYVILRITTTGNHGFYVDDNVKLYKNNLNSNFNTDYTVTNRVSATVFEVRYLLLNGQSLTSFGLTSGNTYTTGTSPSIGATVYIQRAFTTPNQTKCRRDIGHFVSAIIRDLEYGGNYNVAEAAQYYITGTQLGYVGYQIAETVRAFEIARQLCILAMRRWRTDSTQIFAVSSSGTAAAGTASYTALTATNINGTGSTATFNVNRTGGVYTVTVNAVGTNYKVGDRMRILGTSLGGTSTANDLYITVTEVYGGRTADALYTPVYSAIARYFDSTVTQDTANSACSDVRNSINNLAYIFNTIITNGSSGAGSSSTGTQMDAAYLIQRNADFIASEALGFTKNLYPALGLTTDQERKCKRDIRTVLSYLCRDLVLGGNAGIVTAAEAYFTGTQLTGIPSGELAATRYAFNTKVKELAQLAMRNWKIGANGDGATYTRVYETTIPLFIDLTILPDTNTSKCAGIFSAIDTELTLFDTILSGTVIPGATTKTYGTLFNVNSILSVPENTLYDANDKRITPRGLWNDLPIIEASPYIQNASVISFLGGGGCEIDGDKVSKPNCPFPGLELDGSASYPNQGKSMVAAQFTIVSFGGTGYKVVNDGYSQLVSVFVLFCADGVYADSGGYVSITNAATNFGIYALRARGFRQDPYSFDIGTITNVTTSVTGKTVLTITGLGRRPLEHYVIKWNDYRNTNQLIEYFVDAVSAVTVGPPFTATITLNEEASFTKISTGLVVANSNAEFVGKTIKLHRPSIVNSSGHTWEFSGSGTDYNALPENGGTKIEAYEQVSENYGRVYTSGTDELGDFKVGYFARIENRTGNITFTGTVTISEVEFLKLKGGDVVVTGFDASNTLGGSFSTDSKLPTQKAVKDYISNNLGAYLNKPYSTNAVPRALVELTDSGKISIDQIPALRPFSVYTVANSAARLALEGALAGDIAIQSDTSVSYILNNDLTSLFVAFPVDTNLQFTNGNIFTGSISGGQIQATEYRQGAVYKINILTPGSGYATAPTVTISGGNPQAGAVSASATATIANGQVVTITLVAFGGFVGGKGYTTQPSILITSPGGSGVTATASVLIESRLYGTIVNNIKILDTDTISSNNSPTPTVVNIGRVVNTSAFTSSNWVSLSSNQISADNITSGVIATTRLANNSSEANSFTFLRGDQSYVPALQSIKGTESRYFARLSATANQNSQTLLFTTNADILKNHELVVITGIATGTIVSNIVTASGTSTVTISIPLTATLTAGTVIEFRRPTSPVLLDSTYTIGNFIDKVVIASPGSGFTNGTYYDVALSGGTGTGLKANITVAGNAITSVTVTNGGSGYNSDYTITPMPTSIGAGSGSVLAAKIATANKNYANTAIDILRVTDQTLGSDAFGTVGVARFQKSQFTIGAAGNGSVTLKTGADSGLDADLLDGAQGAYYLNAGNLNAGTLSVDRLAGSYNIGISGQSGNTLRLITSTNNPTSSPNPNAAAEGITSDTRNNTSDGLDDGGTKHLVLTLRNFGSGSDSTGGGVRQLAFTDNNNMWIRGSSSGVASYGSWAKVWSSLNDGPGTDLDADKLDNRQGRFYQDARNINYGSLSDNRVPSYMTSKNFNTGIKVYTTGGAGAVYDIYLSGLVLTTSPFLAGLQVNLYDVNSQAQGTLTLTNVQTYNDADDTLDYTILTGVLISGSFITPSIAQTIGTASVRYPFQEYTLNIAQTIETASLLSDSGTARLRLGRKDNTASSPAIYFNSSASPATNYNIAMIASGGNATDGSGSLNIVAGTANNVTINNNIVWNAGNVTFNSTNVVSTAVLRDASGNFAAGTITASLTGAASLNVLKTGDTMTGSLTISGTTSNLSVGGTLGVTGNTTLTGNLTVDTNTLFVDATNNRVGILTLLPTAALDVRNGAITVSDGTVDNGYNGLIRITRATTNNQYINLVRQGVHPWSIGTLNGTSTLAIGNGQATDTNFTTANGSGRITILTTGEVGINKAAATGYALDIEGKARVTTGFEIDTLNDNSGAPLIFLGSSTRRNFRIGNQISVDNGFEITPSTTNGGSTFTTPAFVVAGSQTLAAPASTTIVGAVGVRKTPNTTYGSPIAAFALDISGNVNFDGTLYQNGAAFVASRWTASTNATDIHRLSRVGINRADPTHTLHVGGASNNGINIENLTLTSGANPSVVYANGDRQWLDSYGVFKTNRNSISESITIPANTNAMTAGPITINNGVTITISNGGAWSIV